MEMRLEKRQECRPCDEVALVTAEILPLLTSSASTQEKLSDVAERLSVGKAYETVDFMVLEGEDLQLLRHHHFACIPSHVSKAWEDSVQSRDALSAFAEFERDLAPIIYNDIQTDARATANERQMSRMAGLGSILVTPLVWDGLLRGALAVSSKASYAFDAEDAFFLSEVAKHVSALLRLQILIDDLQAANSLLARKQDDTVMMLALTAEAYDETTGQHLQGIRRVTELLAAELGFATGAIQQIGQAATLHDIGKVKVPHELLLKPGPLTPDERLLIQNHAVWGEALLSSREGFELAARIARWHHERWDGAGYPDGLRGEEIPLEVAIVTVADAYDAIIRARPYKACQRQEWAVAEILMGSGTQFNPRVAEALTRLDSRGSLAASEASLANVHWLRSREAASADIQAAA